MIPFYLKRLILQKTLIIKILPTRKNLIVIKTLLNKGFIRTFSISFSKVILFLKYDFFGNSSFSEFRYVTSSKFSKSYLAGNYQVNYQNNWFV